MERLEEICRWPITDFWGKAINNFLGKVSNINAQFKKYEDLLGPL